MYNHVYAAGCEVDKCRDRLSKYCVGDGLDIGCGGISPDTRFYWENKIVPTAVGVDLARTNLSGRADKLLWFTNGCMDYIFSSHLLEHLEDISGCLSEWFRVLKTGGMLVMYLPLQGFYPDIGKPGANKDHKINLTPNVVLAALGRAQIKYSIISIEQRTNDNEYSFDFVVKKL